MFRYDARRRNASGLKKSAPVVQEEVKSQEPIVPETIPEPVVDEVKDVASEPVVEEKPQKKSRKKKEEVVSEENVGDE